MTIVEYLEAVKQRLLEDPIVVAIELVRERSTLLEGYLRARLALSDQSLLEFSEYIERDPAGEIILVTYSYHWQDSEDNLITRWDNSPHFPALPAFPHHIHHGATGRVTSGQPISIFQVLEKVALQLAAQGD